MATATATKRKPASSLDRQRRLIHVARRELDMDEETYRAILQRVAGVDSTNALDAPGLARVIQEFKRLGFQYKPSRRKAPVSADREELWAKLEMQLKAEGRDLAYADSMAKRMFKLDTVRFANPDQLRRIVAALAIDQRRKYGREYRPGQPWPPTGPEN